MNGELWFLISLTVLTVQILAAKETSHPKRVFKARDIAQKRAEGKKFC